MPPPSFFCDISRSYVRIIAKVSVPSKPGLGWKPGWWLRSRGRSLDGDRKPRPKPNPVASILKFRKPKQKPVASKIKFGSRNRSQWLPELKSRTSKPLVLGFETEPEAKHEARAKAHCSHDARLRKTKFDRKAKSFIWPKHLKHHAPKWVQATTV